jgi:hypothetical protein
LANGGERFDGVTTGRSEPALNEEVGMVVAQACDGTHLHGLTIELGRLLGYCHRHRHRPTGASQLRMSVIRVLPDGEGLDASFGDEGVARLMP